MRLLLIRHGESEANSEQRLQGQGEYPLTERGIEEGRLLAERLRPLSLAALYSSPIRRARRTADAIAEATGLAVTDLPGVKEYDFGELSGLTFRELVEKHSDLVQQYLRGPDYPSFPGAESREAFHRRVSEALWGVVERHPGASVAVVAHGGPIGAFCLEVLGLPDRRPLPLRIDNGSITVVQVHVGPPSERDPRDPRPRATIVTFNDTCHLQELDT